MRSRTHTGWQDTGSALRIHASSAMQPDLLKYTHTYTRARTHTGWQDTGSVLRIHASSAMQPDLLEYAHVHART